MAAGVTVIRSRSGGSSAENPRTVTFDASAAAPSDVFVIGLSSGAGTFSAGTPSDSVTNTYTRDLSISNTNRATIARSLAIANAIVNASTTLSLNTSGTSFKGLASWIMTGGTVSALDKTGAQKTGTGTSMTTNSTGTLTQAAEVAFAIYEFVGSPTFTEPAGWTNLFGAGNYLSTTGTVANVAVCWIEVAATTALTPTATLGTSQNWSSGVVTYPWTAASSGLSLNAPAGVLTLSATAPTLSIGGSVTAPAGALVLSADAPTAKIGLPAPAGVVTLAADAPAPKIGLPVPAGALVLEAATPALSIGGSVTAPSGLLTLHAPVATLSTDTAPTTVDQALAFTVIHHYHGN